MFGIDGQSYTAQSLQFSTTRRDMIVAISPLLLELSMTHLFKQMYSDNILLLKEDTDTHAVLGITLGAKFVLFTC